MGALLVLMLFVLLASDLTWNVGRNKRTKLNNISQNIVLNELLNS